MSGEQQGRDFDNISEFEKEDIVLSELDLSELAFVHQQGAGPCVSTDSAENSIGVLPAAHEAKPLYYHGEARGAHQRRSR